MSAWWDEMALNATEAGHALHGADWYRSMRDQYLARFPDADERSKANMRDFVERAEAREPGQSALDFGAVDA